LLLYSWPASSNYLNYLRDVVDLDWNNPYLIETLTELSARFGPRNLDLIGHSLGARGLVRAMAEMHVAGQPAFATLTLIAPDVDRDLFVRELATLQQMAGQVTVYVSANDRALGVSRRANGYPRAGQAAAGLDYPGIDLVDVTGIDVNGFSGHIYHLRGAAVAEDLRRVLGTANGAARFERVSVESTYHLMPVSEP
jgi:esterase/lipase superfamily enzyme